MELSGSGTRGLSAGQEPAILRRYADTAQSQTRTSGPQPQATVTTGTTGTNSGTPNIVGGNGGNQNNSQLGFRLASI